MSESENDGDFENPYVVFKNPGDIGCNRDYAAGKLKWSSDMTGTNSSDEKSWSSVST